MHHVNGMK
jgi:CCR4-NOT transcriptional regulation complex NOT5 subunit